MNILNGIQNFLMLVNEHWTEIIVIIGLALALYKRVKGYLGKTNEEKIEIAKVQIKETVLRLVTDAEMDYKEWVKAGAVKRAQVVEEIFMMYPILAKVTNQKELVAWIDDIIDEALETMREIFAENESQEAEASAE
jgi:hypothetical protein